MSKVVRVSRKIRIPIGQDFQIYRPGNTIPADHEHAKHILENGCGVEITASESPASGQDSGAGLEQFAFANKKAAEYAAEQGLPVEVAGAINPSSKKGITLADVKKALKPKD